MIEGKDINDPVDRTEFPASWGVYNIKQKKKYNIIKFILICLTLSLLLLWLTSCKKENKKPQETKPIESTQSESVLSGKWVWKRGDTILPDLYLTYCCYDVTKLEYVYKMSYKLWVHTIYVSKHYQKDSIGFDNMIIGAGNKKVIFKRQ